MRRTWSTLFGPVPSRRLGRSLGVDLTPHKTCTFDCVFCQLGQTTRRTLDRREWVPTTEVRDELRRWAASGETADCVTLSGAGEPTLHSGFGEVLSAIRELTGRPAVLLSNGSLFHLREVRAAAAAADIVKLTLSAWDQASFELVHQPHPDLRFAQMVEGFRAFRAGYRGRLWIEVFLVSGMNAAGGDVERMAKIVRGLAPDAVHLNTVTRPPSEGMALPVPPDRLEALAGLFTPRATVLASRASTIAPHAAACQAAILAMLERRPCTAGQVAESFGLHPNEVAKYLGNLVRGGDVRARPLRGVTFYAGVQLEGTHLQ
jgi:wyosine [tRNA(Phe)-imidazoG37] synthetase (radical SAM superfamily)